MRNRTKNIIASSLAILSLLSSPSITIAMRNPPLSLLNFGENIEDVNIIRRIENMDNNELEEYLEDQKSEFKFGIGRWTLFKLCDGLSTMNPKVRAVVISRMNEVLKSFPNIVKRYLTIGGQFSVGFDSESDKNIALLFTSRSPKIYALLLLTTQYYNKTDICLNSVGCVISREMGHFIVYILSILNEIDIDSQAAALKTKILEYAKKHDPDIIAKIDESLVNDYSKTSDYDWVSEVCARYFASSLASKNHPLSLAFKECLDEIDQSFSQKVILLKHSHMN